MFKKEDAQNIMKGAKDIAQDTVQKVKNIDTSEIREKAGEIINNAGEMSNEEKVEAVKKNWKIIIPALIAVLLVLSILFKILGAIFSDSGSDVCKKALKVMSEHNGKRTIEYIPDDLKDCIMEKYSLSEDELISAINNYQHVFYVFGSTIDMQIKKKKITDNSTFSKNKLEEKCDNKVVLSSIKSNISTLKTVWEEVDEITKYHVQITDLKYTEGDDDEILNEKMNMVAVKYKGKWYSLDAMSLAVSAAKQEASKARDEFSNLFG